MASLRLFKICSTLLFVASRAASGAAGAASAPPASVRLGAEASESTAAQFDHAINLLSHGRSFETAIRILRDCVRDDPHSAAYHRALACALVDRAASIAHAASKIETYRDFHERYVKDCERWRAAQEGNRAPLDTAEITADALARDFDNQPGQSPLKNVPDDKKQNVMAKVLAMMKNAEARHERQFTAGSPQPVEPILRTPDDQRAFKLTYDQAKSAFDALWRESMDEFGKSLALATDANHAALTDNAKAWAALLVAKDSALLDEESPFERSVLLDMFQKAIDLRGDSCDYMRSRADAAVATLKVRNDTVAPQITEAIGLYRKALTLERRDSAHIDARIFSLLEPRIMTPLKYNPEIAAALSGAIEADPTNAFLLYVQSCLLLDEARAKAKYSPIETPEGEKALAAIEQANRLTRFETDIYQEAVPASLAVAWAYDNRNLPGAMMVLPLSAMAESLCKTAAVELKAGNRDQARRIELAVVGMGRQLQTALPADSTTWTSSENLLDTLAARILEAGYFGLCDYYKAIDDRPAALQATATWHQVADSAQAHHDEFEAESMFGYRDE